jgi:hypothetical protein
MYEMPFSPSYLRLSPINTGDDQPMKCYGAAEHCGELRGSVPNRLVPRLPCPFKQCNAYEPFLRVALILDEPPAILGVEAVRHVGFASEGTSFGENQCRNIPSGLKA